MKIYTRGGDQGETSLFGGGRVLKDHARIHAYGEIDELNCVFGWCIVASDQVAMTSCLRRESSRLFTLGAHLATPPDAGESRKRLPVWPSEAVATLEGEIDEWGEVLEPLKNFVLPGGAELAARLHIARSICRRAERWIVALRDAEGSDAIDSDLLRYINRLSDWLFTAARMANLQAEVVEEPWVPRESE
ncbi:MAG: cob(I)yrinic acid a,c-diamide adenosyltransferase [Planctomycetes bacterium]|nr:cob(I)yrinic acid a,c-diamide adenosyltransferase [Planctomycetota bacterium]